MNTPTSPAQRSRRSYLDDARERAIAALTDRYADGLLDDSALELGVQRLHAARDVAAIDGLVDELLAARQMPVRDALSSLELPPASVHRRVLALMSDVRRAGRWIVPRELRVAALMGDVKIDLRDAVLPPYVVIDVTACMAAVKITVPPGVPVAFDVGAIIGSATSAAREPDLDEPGPVIRVIGSCVMAEVTVLVKTPTQR